MKSIRTKIVMTAIICALISTCICGIISIHNTTTTVASDSRQQMHLITKNQSEQVNNILSNITQSVNTLSNISISYLDDMEKFQTDSRYVDHYTEQLKPIFLQFAQNTQGALTAYIRFNPAFTKPNSGLFLTRNSTEDDFQSLIPTDFSKYDPSDTEHVGWYYVPLKNKKPTWMEPYLNSNLNIYMVSYVIPIVVHDVPIGVIGMDINFSQISDIVNNSHIFKTGYSFLTSSDGRIMYHKKLKTGSSLSDTEKSLSTVVSALRTSSKEGTPVSYTYQKSKKTLYYSKLSNDMCFILTAPDKEIMAKSMNMQRMIFTGGIAALIISIICGIFNGSRIAEPIMEIEKIIIETSNFVFRPSKNSKKLRSLKDETGQMARSVHDMRNNLRKIVSDISETHASLSNTMNYLKDTTGNVTVMSENNSATTEELAAAMQETSATMDTVNGTISHVEKQAATIKERSSYGKEASQKVKGRAEALKVSTQEAAERTRQMYDTVKEKTKAAIEKSRSVEEIDKLTSTILDISEQTNLLALNASIEAAHAGEAGRGFSVVATEIGQLASETSSTVEDIKQIIEDVHMAVRDMTDCLAESSDFLENTVLNDYRSFKDVSIQYAQDAQGFERDMTNITDDVYTLEKAITEISEAVNGVNNTIAEAAEGISDIAEKTQETSKLIDKDNELVNNSHEHVENLRTILDMFHIEK